MRRLLAGICVLAALPMIAGAASVEETIRARRGFFQLLGVNFGPLVDMARGDVDYDAAAAATHAGNLVLLSGYAIEGLFPEGSDNAARAGETRALPVIWSDADGFAERFGALGAALEDIETAAGEGRAALGPAVGAVGQACQACHSNYRARDF